MAFTYDYFFTPNWSLQLAGGYPPEVDLIALLDGASLGKVGSATAAFPGLLGIYHMDLGGGDFYFGGGFNCTVLYEGKTNDLFNQTFQGTSTDVDIKDSFGGILKIGYQYPISDNFKLDFSMAKYWVTADFSLVTTTPGVGDVERNLVIDIDPNVWFVMLSYDF